MSRQTKPVWRTGVLVATVVASVSLAGSAELAATTAPNDPAPGIIESSAPAHTEAELRARPLKLSTLTPKAACPVTLSKRVTEEFAPILLAGPVGPAIGPVVNERGAERRSGAYTIKVLWGVERSALPVLIRGKRIDFAQRERLAMATSGGVPSKTMILDESTAANTGRVDRTSTWTGHPSSTYVTKPGCYSYQIDGSDFTARVTFKVTT